jgi:hypothetical protein
VASARLFSAFCTVAATVAYWAWLRWFYSARLAFLLGLALAVNWAWCRIGGAIQSEPLYLLLSALALCVNARDHTAPSWARSILLGVLLGACILTRHVGMCLTAAIVLKQLARGQRAHAALTCFFALLFVTPWMVWMWSVGTDTQAQLFGTHAIASLAGSNALFYIRRLPDLVVGPIVEYGTVFRSGRAGDWLTAAAAFASILVGFGWLRLLSNRRRRVLALVPLLTLALLVIWPFTEAGRFLVPLTPMVLAGTVEGLAVAAGCFGIRRARAAAAAIVLVVSIPYSAYAVISNRAAAAERTHANFDAACAVIAADKSQEGPVISRHPGDVYWLSGRQAVAPSSDSDAALARLIARYGVAYLLVDEERYANAPPSVLARYAEAHPEQFARVWTSGGERPVTLYAATYGLGPTNVNRP